MSGTRIERAVRSRRDAPDDRLAGGENRVQFRSQRQLSILIEGNSGESPFQKILIGVHFPGGAGGGPERAGRKAAERYKRKCDFHSFTSTATFFDPVTTVLPVSICSSSILDPCGNQSPCAACALLRINPTDAGGSGRSWPCT